MKQMMIVSVLALTLAIGLPLKGIALAADQSREQSADSTQHLTPDIFSIPENLDESFVALKDMLTTEELQEFQDKSEEKLVEYHFGLGLWVRNEWIRPKGSPLAKYFNDMGIFHPDDMSGIILESFHRHLNGKEINLQEQVKDYQDYWKSVESRQ